jgi:hypothetical protein
MIYTMKCDSADCELFNIEFNSDSEEMECGGCHKIIKND